MHTRNTDKKSSKKKNSLFEDMSRRKEIGRKGPLVGSRTSRTTAYGHGPMIGAWSEVRAQRAREQRTLHI
ncbi:hypothetical protein V6Z12_A09G038400 [Gossypium hirsutum]